MDLPGSSVHRILQARILEWVAYTPIKKKKKKRMYEFSVAQLEAIQSRLAHVILK